MAKERYTARGGGVRRVAMPADSNKRRTSAGQMDIQNNPV